MTRRILLSEHSRERRRLYDLNLRRRHHALRTNLNEVAEPELIRDPDGSDTWAAAAEFEMRHRRYETWRSGGVIGSIRRFTSLIAGDPDYGRRMQIEVYGEDETHDTTALYARLAALEDKLALGDDPRCVS